MTASAADRPILGGLAIPLTDYITTAQGKNLLQSGKVFVYEERCWSGWNGQCILIENSQLRDAEFDAALDMDGTKHFVRSRRETDQRHAKRQHESEMAKRRGREDTERVQAMEAKRKLTEAGLESSSANPTPTPAPEPSRELTDHERYGLDQMVHADRAPGPIGLAPEPEAETPDAEAAGPPPAEEPAPSRLEQKIDLVLGGLGRLCTALEQRPKPQPSVRCSECSKESPANHRNPPAWLKGHMLMHKRKLRKGGKT